MADIAIFRINYKSDFILTLQSDAGWTTPFCIKFWTGAPSQAYFVGYDGTTYTHCAPVVGDPTKLAVQFDDHGLPIGNLKFQIGYHFTVADFPTAVEDEVINQATVIIDQDGTPMQVMLDFQGETAPEIEFSLPAYANEAQRIANEQQRIADEQERIENEQQRIADEETRQAQEARRIAQEAARVSEFATLKSQSQAATSAANTAAALANEKAQLAADKAALAQQKADYAETQGNYAKTQGDYAKEQGDTALADHQRAEADHAVAAADHTTAQADHAQAATDHTQAVSDHEQAVSDHETLAPTVAEHTQEIAELNEKKANTDGYYETLGAGTATNLKGIEVENGTFLYRPSGGSMDIATGAAQIEDIKGNTVAWNQLVQNGDFSNGTTGWTPSGATISASGGICTWIPDNSTSSYSIWQDGQYINGHKYFVSFSIKGNKDTTLSASVGNMSGGGGVLFGTANFIAYSTSWSRLRGIASPTSFGDTYNKLYIRPNHGSQENIEAQLKDIIVVDLTLMFGAGNEPSTVEVFKSWLAQNVGLKDYYPYNAGELVPMKMTGIRTNGFNQWDEEWELGRINSGTGEKETYSSRIKSKNYIPVLGGSSYYFKAPQPLEIFCYDADKSFLSYLNSDFNNRVKEIPSDCAYIMFCMYSTYGTTYNHDICINLSHSGVRNGEYEPYWTDTKQIPVTSLTGKLNGEGSSVVVFADGMKSAGSVHDEIVSVGGVTKAIKRIGSVDLGTLDWVVSGTNTDGYIRYAARAVSDMKPAQSGSSISNILCAIYNTETGNNVYTRNNGIAINTRSDVAIYDSSIQDLTAAQFKSAMSSVMLYYELDTLEEYVLDDFDLPRMYKVDDWGTEEILVPAGDVSSCAPTLGVRYGMNAADTIRRLPVTTITKESMENFLAKLSAAMNGTWTMTWNDSNDEYDYSFTANVESNNEGE